MFASTWKKPFLLSLVLTFSLLISGLSWSLGNSQEAMKAIIFEVNKMKMVPDQFENHIEKIKKCKRMTFTTTDPMALRNLVNTYIASGTMTQDEAEKIAHQYDTIYSILGIRGQKCHYSIKTMTQPEKTWKCSISAKELEKITNFFMAITHYQTNIDVPSYPLATQECHL